MKRISSFHGLGMAVIGLVAAAAYPASAQNLLTNPGFAGDLSGWTITPGSGVTFDPTMDDTGTPGSGSARVPFSDCGDGVPCGRGPAQCVPATAGTAYTFGGKVIRSASGGDDFQPEAQIFLFFSTSPPSNCLEGLFGAPELLATTTTDSWQALSSGAAVAPVGAQSMWLLTDMFPQPDADDEAANFDDLFILPEEPVLASITVVKQTSGGDGDFAFLSDLPGNADFNIVTSGGAGQRGPIPVDPGTYSIVEPESDAWTLISATCDNGDDPAAVTVGEEESVTCTFVNEAVEVVPALPWVAAIALMLLLASSAAWALRRARA